MEYAIVPIFPLGGAFVKSCQQCGVSIVLAVPRVQAPLSPEDPADGPGTEEVTDCQLSSLLRNSFCLNATL